MRTPARCAPAFGVYGKAASHPFERYRRLFGSTVRGPLFGAVSGAADRRGRDNRDRPGGPRRPGGPG